jgi:SAM-dependent methyltransferase
MCGVDIVPAAVKRAQILHPGITFEVGDVTDPKFFPGNFHFVILSECWWYVIDKFHQTIENCLRALEPNGLLVIHQGFLRDGEQKYALDIAKGFDGALILLHACPHLQFVEGHYDDTGTRRLNHGLLMLRKIEHDD